MLDMAIRSESDRQTCSATEMLMSAVTITLLRGLCACVEFDRSLSKKVRTIH
jgi:hypothetical protein